MAMRPSRSRVRRSLGRDAENHIFYHVVIITGDGSARYVWVSALDGQIIKSEKE